jgi:hypothetical protein
VLHGHPVEQLLKCLVVHGDPGEVVVEGEMEAGGAVIEATREASADGPVGAEAHSALEKRFRHRHLLVRHTSAPIAARIASGISSRGSTCSAAPMLWAALAMP